MLASAQNFTKRPASRSAICASKNVVVYRRVENFYSGDVSEILGL